MNIYEYLLQNSDKLDFCDLMGRCGDCRWFHTNFCKWWLQPREIKIRRITCFVPLDTDSRYPLYPTPRADNLRRFQYPGPHGRCVVCGTELSGRKRKYCSKGHRKMYYARFTWSNVRFHLWERDQKCNYCGISVSFDESECDHIIAVALGGEYWDYSNLQILCRNCHTTKTRKDHSKINSVKNVCENAMRNGSGAQVGGNVTQNSSKKTPRRNKMKYMLRTRSKHR